MDHRDILQDEIEPNPILVGIVYFCAASLAVLTTRFENGVAFIWIANAVLLADLLVSPMRRWLPTILCCGAAGMLTSTLFGIGPIAALPLALSNLGEACIAAYLIKRARQNADITGSLQRVCAFVLIAGIIAPGISAFGGAGTVALAAHQPFWSNWFNWYTGHALGAVTFTPVMAMILRGEYKSWYAAASARNKIEAAALMAMFTAISAVVFWQHHFPLLFLPIAPLIAIAFRLGRLGAATAILILAIVGGVLSILGNGPVSLIDGTPGVREQFFQFYLATCFVIALPVAAELNARRRLFRALRDSEARYRLIADNSGDVIMNIDVDGRIKYASPSIASLGGYAPSELIGGPVHALVEPEDLEAVAAAHRRALAEPGVTQTVEYRGLTKAGSFKWCETTTRAVIDERGIPIGVVSAIRDISDRKGVEVELALAASTDSLTGAINRRAFLQALERRMAEVRAGAGHGYVALLDIDFFKRVNDTHGHAAGDAVLKTFVERLGPGLRSSDVIARIGGEEFALILWGASLSEAQAVCGRLRRRVSDTDIPVGNGKALRVTFSTGLARIDPRNGVDEVIAAADRALYVAKADGRNCLRLAA